MYSRILRHFVSCGVLCGVLASANIGHSQTSSDAKAVFFGLKIKAGGRYDNVRACVATPAGVKGGPAADITFYTEIELTDRMSIGIDLPVFRPILFGAAFRMLQLEPEVGLLFKVAEGESTDFVVGPTVGASFHYGPDYTSGMGSDKGPSFFAMGPRIGAFLGVDFRRPEKVFDFQLGLNPYVTPLFGISDPENHKGIVVGGSVDGAFKFSN